MWPMDVMGLTLNHNLQTSVNNTISPETGKMSIKAGHIEFQQDAQPLPQTACVTNLRSDQ